MAAIGDEAQVSAIRAFNRFYTRKIGVVDGKSSSPFSLPEARVLYEIAGGHRLTATEIRKELGLDAGYTSRIVRALERRKLVTRERSTADERQKVLSLTARGRRAFAPLDERSNRAVAAMLKRLPAQDRVELVHALKTVRKLLGDGPEPSAPYLLRQHQPGDLGWIVERQAALYVEEYGWDGTYEGLGAQIVADFVKNHDAKRERCWIAEKDGKRVGAVLLARASEQVAKLRLLHVESEARGLGIGKRLVQECIRFAQQARYRKITLWTQSILHAARHIYKEAGFQVVREEKHHSFGKDLTGETWELDLNQAS